MSRILFVGDAGVSTGFAAATHAVCDHLHASGHEVHVLGLNYYGDPHPYPYHIYPCRQPYGGGLDGMGVTRMPWLVDQLAPDIVVLLNDPWNIRPYFEAFVKYRPIQNTKVPKFVAWLAVDGGNQHGYELSATTLPDLTKIAVWTQYAADELVKGGYEGPPIDIIPLGVDLDIFRPLDRAESRLHPIFAGGSPALRDPSTYVVGVVGRNQLRKRLDLTIQYFAALADHEPRAHLLLHVAPTDDKGCDLVSLVRYYHLENRVSIINTQVGHGVPIETMPVIYSAMNVLLTTTQGEGWGLPMLEAMACGTPVIAPDWSGLGDWAKGAAYLVPCTSTAVTSPLGGKGVYTIGGVPQKYSTVQALVELADPEPNMVYSRTGMERAKSLPWSRTASEFLRLINSLGDA